MIRAIVVDDEPPARRKLRSLLRTQLDVELVVECQNGPEAVAAVLDHSPDLLFLDVQMPEMSGFEVLDAIGEQAPATIFVTAFDEYAVKAFEVHAVDYLLKPIDRDRFTEAVDRVRQRLSQPAGDPRDALLRLLGEERKRRPLLERLVVREVGRYSLLPVDEIDWIEAADNYARAFTGDTAHYVRMTLAELERRLDPQKFARVHRSAIVAIDRIRHIEPWSHGDNRLILRDGTRVTASRTFEKNVQRILSGL